MSRPRVAEFENGKRSWEVARNLKPFFPNREKFTELIVLEITF